jgi:multidrug resistance efflux pump
MRSLQADGFRRWTAGIGLAAALLLGWAAWFFLARVQVYEVTATARLEVAQAVRPIETSVAGRITALHMALGQSVAAGDLLAELDSEAERLRLEQEQAHLGGLSSQLDALRDQVAAEERALAGAKEAARAAVEEARSRTAEAEIAARFADEDLARKTRLHGAGQLPEAELSRARYDAQRARAAAETLRITATRLDSEHRSDEGSRQAHLSELKRDGAELAGQKNTSAALVAQLVSEVEKRKLRAPVSGHVAEIAGLQVGAVLREGERLGALLPAGELHAVAAFEPLAALGRIRPGQNARLRLDGFPWTQYGSVPVIVSSVASEVRDGRIRVELDVHPEPDSAIPLQHGLTGTLEVEVERASPATLALRAAGALLAGPAERPWAAP